MSDEEQGNSTKRGLDISALDDLADETRPTLPKIPALEEVTRAAEAIQSALPSNALQDAMKSIAGGAALEEIGRACARMDVLKDALGPARELEERMRALAGHFGQDSGIGKLAKQLQDQQRSIDALRMPSASFDHASPRIRELPPIPPNPIHETNNRLERIEQRFEQMLDVAANGAEIATGLQAHAAEFLVKFESAASDNNRSAGRAIRLGAIAVVIAVAMPVSQIAYTELWRVPRDSASTESIMMQMQREITALRQVQVEAADRIAAALERSDGQMTEALRDVARSLAAPPPVTRDPEPPLE